jgi:Uma2 family endonuclease
MERGMNRRSPLHAYTYAEYLAHEQASNVKHEYLDGEIYAKAGGTPEQASLAVAVSASLWNQLEGRSCRVFSSDLRVRVAETGLTTYPDVSVVCGALERDPESSETILNPAVIVEILSEGTERYDRGEKFEHYKRVGSLQEYVLVAQSAPKIESWHRQGSSWSHVEAGAGGRVALRSIFCELVVDEVYQGVFDP